MTIQHFDPNELIPLKNLTSRLPTKPIYGTLVRWVKNGSLPAVRVGGRLYVTGQALATFMSQPATKPAGNVQPISTNRQAEIEAAERACEAAGI
ncbi:MAG: helix-turn-helix domain-containing protein [Pirellulales bacterium]